MTIFVTWQLRVTLDRIRNSRNVFSYTDNLHSRYTYTHDIGINDGCFVKHFKTVLYWVKKDSISLLEEIRCRICIVCCIQSRFVIQNWSKILDICKWVFSDLCHPIQCSVLTNCKSLLSFSSSRRSSNSLSTYYTA